MLDGGAVAERLPPLSSFPFPCYIPLDHQRELSPVKDTVLELKNITDQLVYDLSGLKFGPPVTHVYQPLEYARASWDLYCSKYGQGNRRVILVGMNPGPFGMAQVGVPFGEVGLVRDWLEISAPIDKPKNEHPKRQIQGFECKRSEVSGARLWGWAKEKFVTPQAFFKDFFVVNWCPLVMMEESGRNRTPDKLPVDERTPLELVCDYALKATIELFDPEFAIGIGAFAESRVRHIFGKTPNMTIGRVLHPSPASPLANKDWPGQMDQALKKLGVF